MTSSPGPFVHLRANPRLLVGREREQRLLREHLAGAIAGRGRLVLVGGEAGIGKSTLVAAAAQEATDLGVLVLGGACYDLTATPPYGPWRELAAGHRGEDGLPPLPAAFRDDEGIAEARGQGALFAQVRRFMAAVAAVRPAVVVLEDLHWSDPASLDLLRFVARELVADRVLLVGTYRADELTRHHPLYYLLPALVRETGADRIDLRRLDATAVRELIAGRYPLPESDAARLVAHLQARAEGNPFYVRELLRTLEDEAVLRPSGNAWILGDLDRAQVPLLLRQVVDGRVGRLGEEARDLLARAAVIGQEVPLDLWSAVSGRPEEHLLDVAERAVEAHLFEAAGDGASLRFTHALIREALYEGILPLRRRGWHRRAGEALATGQVTLGKAGTEPDPDAVAHHFQQAGDERAEAWLVRAGERAQRAYAWRTAAERLAAATELLVADPARARERGWLLYRVGRLLRFSDHARAHTFLAEAERVAAAVADPLLAAYALVDGGMVRCFGGDLRRGLAEMEAGVAALDALPTAPVAVDAPLTTWVAASVPDAVRGDAPPPTPGVNPRRGPLVMWLANGGRFAEARSMGETYLEQVATVPRPDDVVLGSVADTHHGLGIAYAALGQPDAARRALEQARAAHRAIDHHILVAMGAVQEWINVVAPYRTTQPAERRRVMAEAEAAWARAGEALATGGPPHFAYFGYPIGILLLEGTWADARELERAARADPTVFWSNVVAGLGVLARDQGLPELAWDLVRESLPEGPATEPGGTPYRPTVALQRLAAELALDAGDLGLARAWIEAHDRWLTWSEAVLGQAEALLLWARYHRRAGDTGAAWRQAEAALARAGTPPQPVARLAAHRLLGELATKAGRLANAERHLGESLALADACAAPFERALTLLALAELHAARDRREEALGLLAEGRAVCARLGAAPTLARVDALSATLAAAPAADGDAFGLSARERQVLRFVTEGLTDAEIGRQLAISPRTVGQHLRSVYNKLGVSSRAAATRLAVERRLI
jgi:DNA-binding CsgD family transcriptional regulator/tetratricopeptide (TPR) repeat protein